MEAARPPAFAPTAPAPAVLTALPSRSGTDGAVTAADPVRFATIGAAAAGPAPFSSAVLASPAAAATAAAVAGCAAVTDGLRDAPVAAPAAVLAPEAAPPRYTLMRPAEVARPLAEPSNTALDARAAPLPAPAAGAAAVDGAALPPWRAARASPFSLASLASSSSSCSTKRTSAKGRRGAREARRRGKLNQRGIAAGVDARQRSRSHFRGRTAQQDVKSVHCT